MKLYRFGRLDGRLLKYLGDRLLYFQSPLNFNDPYDCDLDCLVLQDGDHAQAKFSEFVASLRTAAAAEYRKIQRELDRYLEGEGPAERGPAQRQRMVTHGDVYRAKLDALESALAVAEGSGQPGTMEEVWCAFKEYVARSFGLVCFSASPANMLLWSHYGDSHKGLALEYDTEERPVSGWKNYHYQTVHYTDRREIDALAEGYPDAFLHLLTTKGSDWIYEQEHRLISLRGPGFQHNRMANISGTVLGTRFLENPRNLLDAFWEALQRMDRERRSVKKLTVRLSVKVPQRFTLALKPFTALRDVGSYLGC